MSDAAIGSALFRSEVRSVRNPYLVQNTTFEKGESTPGFFFQFTRDIPNEIENGDILTHILVSFLTLGTPESDRGVGPNSADSIAASLQHGPVA